MAHRIDNLSALDWDDTALIKAYNKGMSLRVKDYEKENNTAKENYKKSSKKKQQEWRVGDHCRAVYSVDNLWYEAKIITIDGDTCTIEFLGYDEEAEVELDSLDLSLGKKAIRKQIKNARRNLNISDVDESVSGDDTRNNRAAVYSPHSRHHSHSRRGYHRNNDTYMFDQPNNYTASEFLTPYPMIPCSAADMSTAMRPAAVPPCSEVVQNPSLNAMLTAWYMAGYYTGLHQAQKSASHQHCHCRHS